MKKTKHGSRFNRHLSRELILIAFALSSILLLSACGFTTDLIRGNAAPSAETTSQAKLDYMKTDTMITSQPVDHGLDMNPAPLATADTPLSLAGYGAKGALADDDLTINDMLMYAVQDEYLAHGEYVAIVDKFGSQRPYTNIIQSELTHLAYLEDVYLSYGLIFPLDESADHLIIPVSLLEAAETGVQAEIDNIVMYEHFLTHNLPDNVAQVFSALKSGSESHLLAFQKQVDKLG